MRKKIAFVTPIYSPANLFGSDMFVRSMAEEFARNGIDVSVVTSDALIPLYWYNPFLFAKKIPHRFEVINKVRIYRLASNQFFSSAWYLIRHFGGPLLPSHLRDRVDIMYAGPTLVGLDRLLRREQFDVIHCSPSPLNINRQALDIIRRLPKKPKFILTPFFHTKVREFTNKELGKILRSVDIVHAVTHAEKKDIVRMHNTPESAVAVVPLFLDIKPMHACDKLHFEIEQFKRFHSLVNKKIILFAGLKGSMKGAVDVLHTVYEMHKKNATIALVAMGHNTIEWEEAKKGIDTSFLVDLGYLEGKEKEVVFASCDVYCMPSKSDSFGLVYLEAWHKKKPVIAADVPAMRELILGNHGGLLVPFGNREGVQSAIGRLLDHPVLSKTLGEGGFHALMEKYSLKRVSAQYRRMFFH